MLVKDEQRDAGAITDWTIPPQIHPDQRRRNTQAHDDFGPMTELLDLDVIRDRAGTAAMPHYRDIETLANEVERYRRWVDYLIANQKDAA